MASTSISTFHPGSSSPDTTIMVAAPGEVCAADLGSLRELSPGLVEVHVRGAIEALGNAEAPIRFGRSVEWNEKKLAVSWLGLVLHPLDGRRTSRFKHCEFAGALGGVQCGSGSPVFEDCLFRGCTSWMGVVFGLYKETDVHQYDWPVQRMLLFAPMFILIVLGAIYFLKSWRISLEDPQRRFCRTTALGHGRRRPYPGRAHGQEGPCPRHLHETSQKSRG